MADAGTKDGTASEGIVENVLDELKDLIGVGDDGEEGGGEAEPDAAASALTGADPAIGLDARAFAGTAGGGAPPRAGEPSSDGLAGDGPSEPTISTDVGVSETVGDPLDPDGASVGAEGDGEVTVGPDGVDVSGEGDVGVMLPGGRWGSAHVDVDEDGTVEVTDVEGDLGLPGLVDTPEGYEDSGRVWADDAGAHGRYEFGNPSATEGEPTYGGWAEGHVTEDGFAGAGHAEAGYEGDIAGVPVDASAEVDATATVGPDGAQLDGSGSAQVDTPYGTIGEAEGEGHATLDDAGFAAGARGSATASTWAGEYGAEAEGDITFGQGALHGAGQASLTHDAFGIATETYEAEGSGRVDEAGWDADGEVGYELDIGGRGPDVNVSAGFDTSGEWSDVEDVAHDAGDAAQGTYGQAEDAVNDAGDAAQSTYDSAEDSVNDLF